MTQKGFSLIEVVVYTAVFSVVLVMIVGTALGLARAYRNFSNLSHIERDGVSVLERLMRAARGAESINVSASTLGVNPSVLVLTQTGNAGTARFSVSGGALQFVEDGAELGALTGNKVSVSSFVARRSTTGRSEGVKIELALQSGEGAASTTKKFYATTLLRNSY